MSIEQEPVVQPVATSPQSPGKNEMLLFWASFLTLIAAGIGFGVRTGILKAWAGQFGFTQTELGSITGQGLAGFGVTIIFFSIFADRIGYGPLMIIAFLFHLSSALVTLAATPVFNAYGKGATYVCLSAGMWLFALGNGTCEAVINPLTATLFSRNKTHWLNILHAGWPAGLILGALISVLFNAAGVHFWEVQWAMFLIPTLTYGVLMLGRRFPPSEASASGVKFSTMLLEFGSPILIFLLFLHALVGYVELGTDSWIGNITGTILENPTYGLLLFIWTSGLMFILRFFAGPIVHKISPVGLLFFSAILGCTGLLLLGSAKGMLFCVVAATVYGFGKTFLWPTMLGVASERFPRGGALTLGTMGGVGMLSAGFLGGPGIGYTQDYYAIKKLEQVSAATYERYKVGPNDERAFLLFPKIAGLDGAKMKVLGDDGKQLDIDLKNSNGQDKNLNDLKHWWESAQKFASEDKGPIEASTLYGGQMALTVTAGVPATMAVGYLILLIYFRAIGGYQAEVLTGHSAKDEEFTGGVEGPAEM